MHNMFVAEHFHWKGPEPSFTVRAFNRLLRLLNRSVQLVHAPPMIMGSVESRINLFHFAKQALDHGVPGDFVEVGCHAGFSSTLLQKVLETQAPERKLHVFDSFQGLPPADERDEGIFEPGEMGTPLAGFRANFRDLGLHLPQVHAGWFADTLPKHLPDQIAFALIDADLYASTLTALEHVYPRLSAGALVMLGIYYDPAVYRPRTRWVKYTSPGVKKACDEFFADKPETVSVLYCGDYSSGYFRKERAQQVSAAKQPRSAGA